MTRLLHSLFVRVAFTIGPLVATPNLPACTHQATGAATPDDGSGLADMSGLAPDARALWRQVQGALGGAATLEAVTEISTGANVTVADLPARLMLRSHVDGHLDFDYLFANGEQMTVAVVPTDDGDRFEREGRLVEPSPIDRAFVRGHEYHMIMLAPARRYRGGTRLADTTFAERSCHVLAFTDEFGKPLHFYIDRETLRPVGFVMIEPASPDDAPISVVAHDWRTITGLQLFSRLEIEHRGQRFTYAYTELAVR